METHITWIISNSYTKFRVGRSNLDRIRHFAMYFSPCTEFNMMPCRTLMSFNPLIWMSYSNAIEYVPNVQIWIIWYHIICWKNVNCVLNKSSSLLSYLYYLYKLGLWLSPSFDLVKIEKQISFQESQQLILVLYRN